MIRSNKLHKKLAFTLADIIITVSIIGLVAEMTIPTLIENVKDAQYKSAAKEAFSKASQVIQQIKSDNGVWDQTMDPKVFVDSFASKLKRSDSTSPSTVPYRYVNTSGGSYTTTYKPLYNTYQAGIWMQVYQFITIDGMFWSTCYWNNTTYADTSKFIIFVDVNGYTTPPNIFGRDAFEFQVINGNLLPMGANGTGFTADSYCLRNQTGGNMWLQGLGCMHNVMTGVDY